MNKNGTIILTLFLGAILTELVTANTPVTSFFDPLNLLLLVITYGLPLLVIRDLSVRWKLGFFGVFVLGLAYGIFNEGILAQTLVNSGHLPIESYDHYFRFGGINTAWAFIIVPWHALHAVIFPLLIIQFFHREWDKLLSNSVFAVLCGLIAGGSLLVVLVHHTPALVFLEILMLALVAAARYFRKKYLNQDGPITWTPFLLGILSFAYTFLLFTLAGKAPAVLYFSCAAALPVAGFAYLKWKHLLSHQGMLLFGTGSYCMLALMSIPVYPLASIVNLFLIAVLLLFACRVRYAPKSMVMI